MNTAVSETYFLVTPGGSDRHRALFCLTSLLSPRIPVERCFRFDPLPDFSPLSFCSSPGGRYAPTVLTNPSASRHSFPQEYLQITDCRMSPSLL
jgi:hypothetical protein